MPVNAETAKRLNLLRGSPTFVLRETGDDGRADVLQLARVPADDHVYWAAGECRLPDGRTLPSVFVIAGGGASMLRTYWHVDGRWYDAQHDPVVEQALGAPRETLFPFDWSCTVELADDVFHG